MVRTASTMMPLGTAAPPFELPECDGGTVSLSDLRGGDRRALLVIFMCNHCPYVKHVADQIAAIAGDYEDRGLQTVGVMSNDYEAYPDDAPEKMSEEKRSRGYRFPYLVDADQSVARAYGAACTPDFYLFDGDHRLVYRGQLDSTRPKQDPPQTPDGSDLRAAIDAVLNNQPVPDDQSPSIGCNIKWRSGGEPDYFNPAGTA